MREESQLEGMRAALRGDRERAERARQRSQENVRALAEEPKRSPVPAPEASRRALRSLFRRR